MKLIKHIFVFQMGFVILGFLAMILFELIVINEMPKTLEEEIVAKLDLIQNCVLTTIPVNLTLPMNFTCYEGYLEPA
jgi:hypothetical protein